MGVVPSRQDAVATAADTFSYEMYKAGVRAHSGCLSQFTINYILDKPHLTQLVVENESGKDLDEAVANWKAVRQVSDPAKGIEYVLDEKGYCEAIIFSVFLDRAVEENALRDAANAVKNEADFLCANIDAFKAVDGITPMTKMSGLSASERLAFARDLETEFGKNHPVAKGVG